MDTALTEEVADRMKVLLAEYNGKEGKTFENIQSDRSENTRRNDYEMQKSRQMGGSGFPSPA